jgi:hypothetical protein
VHRKRPLVADQSVDQAPVVRAGAVAWVVGHRDSVHRGEVRSKVRLAAEVARRVAATDEKPEVHSSRAQARLAVAAQPALPRESLPEQEVAWPRARVSQPKAESLEPLSEPQQVQQQPELAVQRWEQEAEPQRARAAEAQQQRELAQPEQPASAQLPLAAVLPEQPQEEQPALVPWQQVQPLPAACEPLVPLRPSLPCPLELSLQPRLLRPRRLEGACEPSRLHPLESSWSASSFLERRTRAKGR